MKTLLSASIFCVIASGAFAHQQTPAPASNGPTANQTVNTSAASRSTAAAVSRSGAQATTGPSSARTGPSSSRSSTGPVTVNNSAGGGYGGPRYTTPDAIAPSVVTANECALPRSFGISAILAGASSGWANESEDCKRLRQMQYLARTGDAATAREIACQADDAVRRAAYSAGRPCARDARGWAGY